MAARTLKTMRDIRTGRHIRTYCSLHTSTGPGRASWPRLQETERLQLALKRLARLHDMRGCYPAL